MRACVVIPFYNHERAIGDVVQRVRAQGVPCIVVDDGSHPRCAPVLDALAAEGRADGSVSLLRLPKNRGKGVAVMAGLAAAQTAGFTHAVQLDADGQHCVEDLPRFLAAMRADPAAVIAGVPVYDASVPPVRFYGRYLTHVLTWLNTLSFDIRDSMCGFRAYPVAPALAAWREMRAGGFGARMDFDTEILVRLHWRGLPIVNLPTAVTYPSDGVSHFRMVKDNARLTVMHARLFLGMLRRLPRRLGDAAHLTDGAPKR